VPKPFCKCFNISASMTQQMANIQTLWSIMEVFRYRSNVYRHRLVYRGHLVAPVSSHCRSLDVRRAFQISGRKSAARQHFRVGSPSVLDPVSSITSFFLKRFLVRLFIVGGVDMLLEKSFYFCFTFLMVFLMKFLL
jgi:hypothetical protein